MAYLSGPQLGAESPGGGRKNSARLSQRREKPRFRQALRTVVKSGLKSDTKSRNSPFTGAQTQSCSIPTNRCVIYLSSMSLVSLSSFMVIMSFSVSPHAYRSRRKEICKTL